MISSILDLNNLVTYFVFLGLLGSYSEKYSVIIETTSLTVHSETFLSWCTVVLQNHSKIIRKTVLDKAHSGPILFTHCKK